MPGIQLSGLASGLDTASIIDQLMAVERQPRTRIEMRQASEQARRDGLNQVPTQLKTLQDAATALRSAATWADTQTATSTDTTKLDVTRTGGAGPGGYDIAITRLASSTQRTYSYVAAGRGHGPHLHGQGRAGRGRPHDDLARGGRLARRRRLDDQHDRRLPRLRRQRLRQARAGQPHHRRGLALHDGRQRGRHAHAGVGAPGPEARSSPSTARPSLRRATRSPTGIPGLSLTLKGTHEPRRGERRRPGPDASALSDKVKALHRRVQHGRRLDPREGHREAGGQRLDDLAGEDRRALRRRRAQRRAAPAAPGGLGPDRRQRHRARRDGRAGRQHGRRVGHDQRRLASPASSPSTPPKLAAALDLRPARRAQAARRHLRDGRLRAADHGHPRPCRRARTARSRSGSAPRTRRCPVSRTT